MKVIFLDIDGVLNTEETFRRMKDYYLDVEIDSLELNI